MPLLSRAAYRRELAAWSLLPVMVGVVEGGVTGVLAKNIFDGVVPDAMLNLAVAILAGAPAVANITSFVWAAVSHGKHKIRFLWGIQLLTVAMVSLIALAPINLLGLAIIVIGAIGTRICWTGVMILRTTVWRANYPRYARARMAGNLATVQSVMMMASGLAVGVAMNVHDNAFRFLYPVAGLLGLAGAWIYKRLRVRRHPELLRREQEDHGGSVVNPWRLRRILHEDDGFRRYMTSMFVFGIGNLMVMAPLVVMLKDRFALDALTSVLIVTSIPFLLMPLAVPMWSRLLDRVHIVRYRAVHSWAFVATSATLLVATVTTQVWLLFIAAILKGIAISGGVLGWNLGHHDFASPERAGQYMSVHTTLTGIRGVCAPLIGIALYEMFEYVRPGAGAWVFALFGAISLVGAISFVVLARSMRREQREAPDPCEVPPSSSTTSTNE